MELLKVLGFVQKKQMQLEPMLARLELIREEAMRKRALALLDNIIGHLTDLRNKIK
jgi:hypothetical protein